MSALDDPNNWPPHWQLVAVHIFQEHPYRVLEEHADVRGSLRKLEGRMPVLTGDLVWGELRPAPHWD